MKCPLDNFGGDLALKSVVDLLYELNQSPIVASVSQALNGSNGAFFHNAHIHFSRCKNFHDQESRRDKTD